jgi:hypothetical protein
MLRGILDANVLILKIFVQISLVFAMPSQIAPFPELQQASTEDCRLGVRDFGHTS